jgi:septum site-determining protein MinD
MTKHIALISGKGGTGKTTTAVNLALALNKTGKKVVLVDGNLATPNVMLHFGVVKPVNHLNSFLLKEKSFKEIIYQHHDGTSIIPASISLNDYHNTNFSKISRVFDNLEGTSDFVLVDSPSGLNNEVMEILKNTDEVLVVVNPTTSSVLEALKSIELAKKHDNFVAGAILNMSNRGRKELSLKDVEQILNVPVIANVRHHSKFRKSLHSQEPLYSKYGRSSIKKEYDKIANYLTFVR